MIASYRFHLAYRGEKFAGFQAQAHVRTVSQEFQKALFLITGENPVLQAAGRTDAGVHAHGQVISAKLETKLSLRQLTLALATKTPSDLSIWRIDKMPLGFDARRHSVGKQYIYRIAQGLVPDVHMRDRSWHVRAQLDHDAMRRACAYLIGEHDFESFRGSLCSAAHAVRYIWHMGLSQKDKILELDIRGNAFCLNMVRIIVGTLVDVGRGKLKPEDIKIILDAKDRRKAGMTARPEGLSFAQVYYPDDLSNALIPKDALFPRFPVSELSWPFDSKNIEYGPI
jgi:tRNA pseudouridine38-40 synthase